MSPFDPIGERARWKLIYDQLVKVPVDGVLTYDEMGEVLDLDPDADRQTIQMAMRRANKELEETENRTAEAIKNQGYRVVQAIEHLRLARVQQRKAGKALKRGHSKAVHVDFNQVDAESRKAFEVVAQAFALQMEFNAKMDIRQKRLEQVIGVVVKKGERTDDELTALRERIARLEQKED